MVNKKGVIRTSAAIPKDLLRWVAFKQRIIAEFISRSLKKYFEHHQKFLL